jgi:phosphatidylglycerol---prolipoprotein diacylglyceryl transferase
LALRAVPAGLIGSRVYHVLTDWRSFEGRWLDVFKIWQGGLGIWGAVALGALGAWIGCRRRGVPFLRFADCAAPGIAVAQALGRFGNYFNNELYGTRTNLPWGLEIHQWDQAAGHAVRGADGAAVVLGTFQPTFLYESIWCLVVAATIVWAERRFGLAHGRVFALYVMLYTVGRGVIEMLRTDEANHILGLRLNVWTSVLVFIGALYGFWRAGRRALPGDVGHKSTDDTAAPASQ